MNINGKTALVTGGTEGIGLEIARQLLAKGAKVIVCSRREDLLESARLEGLEALTGGLPTRAGERERVKLLEKSPLNGDSQQI